MISLNKSVFQFVAQKFSRNHEGFVYVAMGDSATAGIGASRPERSFPSVIHKYLKNRYKKTHYHNLGKRRSPTRWVIDDQLDKAIDLQPDLVTISTGANDIRVKNLPWKFEEELHHLIRKLKTETNAVVVINSIPNFTHTSWVPLILKPVVAVAIRRFNKIIEKVAREEGIIYVDLNPHTLLFAKMYPEAMADDNFHPSDFGYALWANSIIHTLQGSPILRS